ncbi:MFS family permease [Bradyrhizobium sp. GM5.1]
MSGVLSDRIGRRPLIVTGLLLAAALYIPIYMGVASATAAHNYVAVTALILAQLVLVMVLVYGRMPRFSSSSFRRGCDIPRCRFRIPSALAYSAASFR